MKTYLIIVLAAGLIAVSCNNNKNTATPGSEQSADTVKSVGVAQPEPAMAGFVNPIVAAYLQLKNALADDNGKEAASAAHGLHEAVNNVDTSRLSPEQKKIYADVQDDIKEHAEHIGAHEDNIAHQREHFDMLSSDMYDLVKVVKPSQTLYKDFCPMYHDNKGASWISESKEIKNPYLGKKMTDCGEVKEVIK